MHNGNKEILNKDKYTNLLYYFVCVIYKKIKYKRNMKLKNGLF